MTGRREHDLLGEREVPADALWGIHTLRAQENFPLSGRPPAPALIRAMAQVKAAAAITNRDLGFLAPAIAEAILAACAEMEQGDLNHHIVVDALQGGAGTSLNMNVNEVLANCAEERLGGRRGEYALVDPHDHLNLHQSTNDVFPTALRVAAITLLKRLEPAIAELQTAFQQHEAAWADVIKLGRTQLQDAAPMTLAAEASAWAEALSRDRWRVFKCEERLRVVNLGGTAIGTGLTAPRDYIFRVVEVLRERTGLPLARAENLVDATQNADPLVEVSGILKAHAVTLFKISSDLRLLASGPRGGLGELILPAVQAGSSLMPGKINPVIAEAAGQSALAVIGYDAMVTAAAMSGQLELNAFLPLLAEALLSSLSLLEAANRLFAQRCVKGLEPDRAACAQHLAASWASVTALVPVIGHARAADLAALARASGRPVVELAIEQGLADAATLERLLSPAALAALGYRG